MRPEVMQRLREAHDLHSLTRDVLDLCEPYGPGHSFKLVHNRGAARVVCFIELESPKQQPLLVRALGAKVIHRSACLDIPVSDEFGQMSGNAQARLAIPVLRHEVAASQVTN